MVTRAKALLLAGNGVANSRIATTLGIGRPTVLDWRARFGESPIRYAQERFDRAQQYFRPGTAPYGREQAIYDAMFDRVGREESAEFGIVADGAGTRTQTPQQTDRQAARRGSPPLKTERAQDGGGCRLQELGIAGDGPVIRGSLGYDCVAPNWTGELARYYSFVLQDDAQVQIVVASSEIDVFLGLRHGWSFSGALLHRGIAQTGQASGLTASLNAGAYTIEVASPEEGVATTGWFALSVREVRAGAGVK